MTLKMEIPEKLSDHLYLYQCYCYENKWTSLGGSSMARAGPVVCRPQHDSWVPTTFETSLKALLQNLYLLRFCLQGEA